MNKWNIDSYMHEGINRHSYIHIIGKLLYVYTDVEVSVTNSSK